MKHAYVFDLVIIFILDNVALVAESQASEKVGEQVLVSVVFTYQDLICFFVQELSCEIELVWQVQQRVFVTKV